MVLLHLPLLHLLPLHLLSLRLLLQSCLLLLQPHLPRLLRLLLLPYRLLKHLYRYTHTCLAHQCNLWQHTCHRNRSHSNLVLLLCRLTPSRNPPFNPYPSP